MKFYTKEHDLFISKSLKAGMSSKELAVAFKKQFKVEKTASALVKHAQHCGFSSTAKKKSQTGHYEKALAAFIGFVKDNNYVPSLNQLAKSTGINRTSFYTHFQNLENLEAVARERNPEVFSELVSEDLFSFDQFLALQKRVKKHKRFVVTTAIAGCKVHEKGLAALENYCKVNKAMLLVLPVEDPAKTKQRKHAFSLDSRIPNDSLVFQDLYLNDNLLVSTIKLSAKQIHPLTGLKRLGILGSIVLGSPKQYLEHVANSNKREIPRAIMTTGAITVPDYRTELYMSERTAYLATEDHMLGAVVVEIKDNKIFYYRRVQINPNDGSFYDLHQHYYADKVDSSLSADVLNFPDWHTGNTDPTVREMAKYLCWLLQPKTVTLEDFFDGSSINPHEKNNIVKQAKNKVSGFASLEKELDTCADELLDICDWDGVKSVLLKYGNHEDFLSRWLSGAEYAKDPTNHYTGVCLAKNFLEDEAPFEAAMRASCGMDIFAKVRFLNINDSVKINGIENAVHGHIGSSGRRNPGMAGLEIYGPCTTGHSHSAAIYRNVVRVGTATHLQLSYNDGASAWTQTFCIQHPDGARQLISVINGEICLPDILGK